MTELAPLDNAVLPPAIRSRFVERVNGLRVHILEAGELGHPCLLLLHGFPELAYSWRKIMGPMAAAGYHVVAPDLRGYGRTTGWSANYDDDLHPFRHMNAVRDALGLVAALGYRETAAVVGHNFGAGVAAWCALVRPDVFRRLALMSAPFEGPPSLPFATDGKAPQVPESPTIHEALAALPRPRKHYQWWYSTRPANAAMWYCKQGVHDFLRAYYHHKSADWKDNKPHKLTGWTATELSKMPTYYVMDLADDMPTAVARRCRRQPRSPPATGCPRSSRFMPASTGATGSRAGSTGIARVPAACSRPSCSFIPARPSTCRRSSSRVAAIGASTSAQAQSKNERHRLHADDRRPPAGRRLALGATGAG